MLKKSIIAQYVMLNSFQHLSRIGEARDPELSSGWQISPSSTTCPFWTLTFIWHYALYSLMGLSFFPTSLGSIFPGPPQSGM